MQHRVGSHDLTGGSRGLLKWQERVIVEPPGRLRLRELRSDPSTLLSTMRLPISHVQPRRPSDLAT